ncbi:hypothetical protein SLEP1_g54995 [Rubroshorea leprosula]|uniref:Uncharacterized protein n=1 Tax=Rubroshorea leprosula TaxID=152421 RepID=A0AAV5MEY8_9ROSI|nr:hypothetical protein SLEP1_g54995 [Rubroshorea leprosula]
MFLLGSPILFPSPSIFLPIFPPTLPPKAEGAPLFIQKQREFKTVSNSKFLSQSLKLQIIIWPY